MTRTLQEPGNYVLKKLQITSYSGTVVNLSNLMVELNVFEDIFSNVLTGNVVISDGLNIIKNLPIIGEETLDVIFHTAGKNDEVSTINRTFNVYKISSRSNTTDRSQVYVLHFASPEAIKNAKQTISKAYTDKPEDSIRDILKTYLQTDKTLNLDPTRNTYPCIVPNLSPFDTINWLSDRSASQEFNGASYLFYENHLGFEFRCLESLYSQEPKQNYIYQPANTRIGTRDDYLEESFRNIKTYTIKESFNKIKDTRTGVFGHTVGTFDPLKKKYVEREFSYNKSFDDYVHLGDGKISTEDDFSRALYQFMPVHSEMFTNKENQDVGEWFSQRKTQIGQLRNLNILISVPGDSELLVGDLVNVSLPSPETGGVHQEKEKYLTGKFLVTSIRHMIKAQEYSVVVELSKDSLTVPLP